MPLPQSMLPHRWILDALLAGAAGSGIVAVIAMHDAAQFVGVGGDGVSPAGSAAGARELQTDGMYRLVRHPMYTFTIISLVIGTKLSLDRVAIMMGVLGYLYGFGIDLEEAALVETFGPQYLEYRRRTPAVVPGPIEGWVWSVLEPLSPSAATGARTEPKPKRKRPKHDNVPPPRAAPADQDDASPGHDGVRSRPRVSSGGRR
jgi:protein-S-isoprenylcysteine O-methyltransferase Ste14